jgi:hypothetical protein
MLFSFPQLFLAGVFVRSVGCSGCTPQERGCAAAACVSAYKNHDKKSGGQHRKAARLWGCLPCLCGVGLGFSGKRILFSIVDFILDVSNLYPIVSKTKLPPTVAVLNTRTNGATFQFLAPTVQVLYIIRFKTYSFSWLLWWIY